MSVGVCGGREAAREEGEGGGGCVVSLRVRVRVRMGVGVGVGHGAREGAEVARGVEGGGHVRCSLWAVGCGL